MILLLLIILLLTSCTTNKELIVLIPDSGGTIVVNDMLVSKPLDGVAIKSDNSTHLISVDQQLVNERFGSVLKALPSPGRVYTLYFAVGGTEISNESQPVLDELLQVVTEHINIVEIEVTGHTDNKGSVESNDILSLSRAQAISDILKQAGLNTSFIRIVGRGERDLLIKTEDERDEPLNRRVEVLVR